jgi:phytoene desaturase
MSSRKKIIVIGSGFGGLGAACRLAARGHDVTLYEKRDKLGGRAYQYEINGFKFDGGPTVMTVPSFFDEIYEEAGRKREDYFKLTPLDPYYRIFNDEGRGFNYWSSTENTIEEIRKFSPGDVDGYVKFVKFTEQVFKSFQGLTDRPFLALGDMLKIMPDIIRLQAFWGTYFRVSQFIKDEFLRRVFSFHPLLVGGNPFDTPSVYTLVAQFEKQWGVHYGIGGTGAVVSGLGQLFTDLGGKVFTNTEIKEIVAKDRRVVGVRFADGSVDTADVVVSNGDVAHTYRYLIPEQYRRKYTNRKLDRMAYSMSLVVIYFGTKKRYLDSKYHHHNIMLNQRYKGLLSDIFAARSLPKDFSLYLHMPTITDSTIAPEGTESFYVLAPVPHLDSSTDWKQVGPAYRDRVMDYLEENYLPGLQDNIVAEHMIDPVHFRDVLNSYKGAAFSVRPSLMQLAWFRPHNRSEEFDNLYFVGAGTHPGAGVPAVLASGKIAANLIDPTPAHVVAGRPAVAVATA